MPKLGAFTFVLHSHLPYARRAGRWPHGEEWLHEAAAETYVPLLDALNRLKAENVPAHVTLSMTPILLEQLADEEVQANFGWYLDERISAAQRDVARFQEESNPQQESLAGYYRDWYEQIQVSFREKYGGNLVPAIKSLREDGFVQVTTSAATHGYLPLLKRDESINLQIRTGTTSFEEHMGAKPEGIWLPECAYRPGYRTQDGQIRPGIEHYLHENGLTHFFTETHMIQGGRPVGIAAGEAVGPYGAVTRRYTVPFLEGQEEREATTFNAYYVYNSEVCVIGRDNHTGLQVWSADWGYPGDYDYREFHKKDGVSGLQYWRITGAQTDLADKELYHPEWARAKVEAHADHFAGMVIKGLTDHFNQSGEYGLVAAIFDTELFGHWWFEGVDWLEAVLRRLSDSEVVEVTTAKDYLASHPPQSAIRLPEGSWGAGGNHFVWDNPDTHWMWPEIHRAEERMLELVQTWPNAEGQTKHALNQAARELLLLQSSDWPFLVTTGQADEYATQRFKNHLERFHEIADAITAGSMDEGRLQELWQMDKIFPSIDYRWFRK